MDWTWYLFRFDGRINRALLWQALLIVAVLVGLLGVIGQVIHLLNAKGSLTLSLKLDFDFGLDDLFKLVDPRAYRSLASFDRADLILKASGLALFSWIFLATAIKRLHDRDRSGWWIVPFFCVPGLFNQFSDLLPDSNWVLPFSLTASSLWLWGIVEMFCRARHRGRQPVRPRSAGRSRGRFRIFAPWTGLGPAARDRICPAQR